MDRVTESVDLEQEVNQLVSEYGLERAEAITIVALRHGEVYGDGDLVSMRPLTEEQLARSGVNRSLREVLAAQRQRLRNGATRASLPDADEAPANRRPTN